MVSNGVGFKTRDWCKKKPNWAKNSLLVKNPQFWLYPHETWSKEQPHEVVIFTKFHEDRAKTVDFLLLVNFWPSPVFFAPVSIRQFVTILIAFLYILYCENSHSSPKQEI